jgi:hypothetical protein
MMMRPNQSMNIKVNTILKSELDADRKKGNFEKDLDSMLFGGMGPAPVRRRATGQTPEAKTAEQPKSVEQPKPAVTSNTP